MHKLPRQLVICCDGTNNNLTGGLADTNVVKLVQLLAQSVADPARIVFYDPGVGNAGELPGVTVIDRINRFKQRLVSLAFGRGVYENMEECYQFLMQTYQTGDQIYIFGFSRGAFTARSLAGLINQFGILQPHMVSMLPTLLQVYFSNRSKVGDQFQAIAKQTPKLFAAPASRYVEIQFVGVWDTVDSVGMWPFSAKITAKPTIQNKCFVNVRHALALDEHRFQFKPRLYSDNNGTYRTKGGAVASIKQLWFHGAHGDVGGGYRLAETAISEQALRWMVSEAVQCGLRLSSRLGAFAGHTLSTEDTVGQALHVVYQDNDPSTATIHRVIAHSQLRQTPLWAITGMAVRSTNSIQLDDEKSALDITPVAHPSVAAQALRFPQDTVWVKSHDRLWFGLGLVLVVGFMLLIGYFQTNPSNVVSENQNLLQQLVTYLQLNISQNISFARWQLLWWRSEHLETSIYQFASPRTALVADLALIITYAYVLSWMAVRAFARIARLRQVGDGVDTFSTKWLNRLGWALPVAVFADVGENIVSWFVITFIAANWEGTSLVLAALMTLLATAKFVGLIGVAVLLLWSLIARGSARGSARRSTEHG